MFSILRGSIRVTHWQRLTILNEVYVWARINCLFQAALLTLCFVGSVLLSVIIIHIYLFRNTIGKMGILTSFDFNYIYERNLFPFSCLSWLIYNPNLTNISQKLPIPRWGLWEAGMLLIENGHLDWLIHKMYPHCEVQYSVLPATWRKNCQPPI